MNVSSKFIKRLQQCEKQAFETLFKDYSGLIKAIAYRYTKNWQIAEDILQETFIVIYRKIHQYSHKGSFEGWIKRIAVNNCLKYLKEQQKNVFKDVEDMKLSEEETEQNVNVHDIESLVKNTDFSQKEIFDVVETLPDGFRIVFSMYVLENYKHKEIAELLGISESTSKTQLLRARKLIQKKLYKIALDKYSNQTNKFFKEVIGNKDETI
ncbi:MAG: RNA polymerase sigma factor [Bacteroidales bacterium]|nr:RNA polymerase sigma factor [Bacteroidales bacterium]